MSTSKKLVATGMILKLLATAGVAAWSTQLEAGEIAGRWSPPIAPAAQVDAAPADPGRAAGIIRASRLALGVVE
jgi:hypothetical protein